jgi:L-alanine-DL-glutamate epimerase-like enolase superfamily enzyme
MSKFIDVEARTIRVPLNRPTAFARRQVTAREYSLVRIRTEDAEGIGHCYAGHAGGAIVTLAVRDLLAPLLRGAESTATELLWKQMYQETLLHGHTGAVMRALSILDIALWDATPPLRLRCRCAWDAQTWTAV